MTCAGCGHHAERYAHIGPATYCHDSDGRSDRTSCWEQAMVNRSRLAQAWGLT